MTSGFLPPAGLETCRDRCGRRLSSLLWHTQTHTPCVSSSPSISVSRVDSSRSPESGPPAAPPPSPPPPSCLLGARASASSRKIMEGQARRARLNVSRSTASPSPTYMPYSYSTTTRTTGYTRGWAHKKGREKTEVSGAHRCRCAAATSGSSTQMMSKTSNTCAPPERMTEG